MINLNVPFIHQNYDFDCWYAALRMLVKFRVGAHAEPLGYEPAERGGMEQESIRESIRAHAHSQDVPLHSYEVRRDLRRNPPRGLNANEFVPFAQRNGLVSPTLPPPYNTATHTGGWTLNALEALLRIHGPLWCAFGYGHIIVVKGVDAHNNLLIHNPQGGADETYTLAQFNNLLHWPEPHCIMFMPPPPNNNAFLGL